jgi:hypothetical protein
MTQIWALYRQSGSDRLEKQPTDLRQYTSYFGDRTLASVFNFIARNEDEIASLGVEPEKITRLPFRTLGQLMRK